MQQLLLPAVLLASLVPSHVGARTIQAPAVEAVAATDTAPLLGVWELSGRGGRDWEGALVLRDRVGNAYAGYILWTATSGSPASGREPVEGAFDPDTGFLALRGRGVIDAVGNITSAEYEARVGEGGRRLVDGVWGGRNVIPGAWSASWTPVVARTPHFAFHASELFGLHHFLYQCAKARARQDGERTAGRPVPVAEIAALDALEGAERDAWRAAVSFYRREAIAHDLLFNGTMYALKGQLTAIADPDGEWPADLDAGYAKALRTALPVYRAHFRSAHDATNRAWIRAAVELLERYETELVRRMTSAYGGAWPPAPVRVDVCAYANWAGAYTTGNPAHITLGSSDPQAQGHGALETLVHEASHTPEMFGALRNELAAAYAARGAEPPRDLWHVFIFVTAGEAVRAALAADGAPGYVHYGERTGLYRRGAWAEQVPLVLEPWSAFLEGDIDRATALARIAETIE